MWHGTFIHGIDIEALTCIFMLAKQCESVLRKRKARKKRKARAYNVQAFSKHPKQSWDKSKRRLLSPGLGGTCVLHSDFRHGMHSVAKADVISLSKPHVNCPPVTLFLCSPCWALWDLLKQRRRSSLESIVACQLGQGSFFCFAATERGKAGMIGASLPPCSRVRAGTVFLDSAVPSSHTFRKRAEDADCNMFLAQELGSQEILTCLGQISGFR